MNFHQPFFFSKRVGRNDDRIGNTAHADNFRQNFRNCNHYNFR